MSINVKNMQKGDKVRVIHERNFRYATIGIITAIDPCIPHDINALNLKYLVKFPCIIGNYGMFDESELEVVLDKIGSKEALDKAVKSINGEEDILSELDNALSMPTANALAQLKGLVIDYKKYQSHIDYLNSRLKEQKELFNKVSQSYIPELLGQYNLDDIKLKDTKEKIIIKTKCNVSIKKDMKEDFYEFLRRREQDDIIKQTLTIYNPSPEVKRLVKQQINKEDEALETYEILAEEYETLIEGYEALSEEEKAETSMPIQPLEPKDYKTEFESGRKIHPKTLEAYARRELQEDSYELKLTEESTQEEILEEEELIFPPESLTLFVYSSTKIK